MLGLSALPTRTTSQTERPSEGMAGVSSRTWSWMRGVPQGYRLISLELPGEALRLPVEKARGGIGWQYVDADGQQVWTVLLEDVEVLHCEPLPDSDGGIRGLRLIVPLAPRQADRLKMAAACGALRLQIGEKESARSELSMSTWQVVATKDRTREIEQSLAKEKADPDVLERPTLAESRQAVIGSIRGTITVPVEVK